MLAETANYREAASRLLRHATGPDQADPGAGIALGSTCSQLGPPWRRELTAIGLQLLPRLRPWWITARGSIEQHALALASGAAGAPPR